MRIVYLSSSAIPSREANSIHVMKMCQALATLGHEVILIAPDAGIGLERGVSDPFGFYGVMRCFELRRLPWRRIKGRGWLYGMQAGAVAKHVRADLAVGRNLLACAIAARLGVPTIWEAHTLAFLDALAQRQVFRWMTQAAQFRKLVVISEALQRAVLDRVPLLANCVMVAHDAADPVDDGNSSRALAPNDHLQVGYMGHLYKGKGFEVVSAVAERCPWADFHIAGGNEKDLKLILDANSIPDNVIMHGFLPPSQVQRVRTAMDVLLAPYQDDVRTAAGNTNVSAWMSPLKVFEYMAAGKAIICSDIPVLTEVLSQGETALFVSPTAIDAWVEALTLLRNDPLLRMELGRCARDQFLRNHTWATRAARIISGI